MKSTISRVLNAVLWLTFSLLGGTGLLLAFRLSECDRGAISAAGWDRHDWGEFHTWLSYAFLALVAIHLCLHWRWFWQVAARKRSWPLIAGLGAGLFLMAGISLLPLGGTGNQRPPHHKSGGHDSEDKD